MKEVALQRIDRNTLKCFSEEDADAISEFPVHKLLRAKITGALKPRSYDQLKLFWSACRTVSENKDDENFATENLVAEWVKVKLKFIDYWMVIDGSVHIKTRSISYKELPHMEACNFFDRAFDVLAKSIGVTKDELLQNAEDN